MKWLVRLAAVLVGMVVVAIGVVWMTVPVNAPWKSMLQQMSLLPAWLDPEPISADQIDGQLIPAPGYRVSLFATGVPDARGLHVTDSGHVLVTTPRDGRVMLLEADDNGDGAADGQRVLLDGLTRPNGLDVWDAHLYVAEEDGVGRVAFDGDAGTVEGSYERIINGLPSGGNHWRKTIRFGPDGHLYLAVGSSCNVCVEDDTRRAAILRYTADGDFVDVYATGLRNSAGFDWSPATGSLYATDNGRDMLGDDFPPCELNEVVEGGFYGWPYANGAAVADPDFGIGEQAAIDASIPPVHGFRAHNAPLGIVFLRQDHHRPDYRDTAIVALHGSWNRSEKDGYKVVSLHFGTEGRIDERDFLTGFLNGDTAIGRPTDVVEGPDGSVYVSDDFGSAVYRVRPIGAGGDTRRLRAPIAGAPGTFSPAEPGARYDPTAVTDTERSLALGSGPTVFANQECHVCHAARPTGEPPQVELRELGSRYTLDGLVEYLATPNPPMPPYDASVEERRALALFLLERY